MLHSHLDESAVHQGSRKMSRFDIRVAVEILFLRVLLEIIMINFCSGKNVLQTAQLDIIGFDECEMSE